MESILASDYAIHFNTRAYTALNDFIQGSGISKIFIIVDANTHQHCYPHFMGQMETDLEIEIIEIEAGEIHKSIETCVGVWKALSELDADRKSLIINVGGGVTTDLGGFVASTYKRGLKYINVPTSLLAMVDASVGGKTGVDLDTLKNQIGVINSPEMVLVDTDYLHTLPAAELRSGFAEMLKHGLISGDSVWSAVKEVNPESVDNLQGLIYDSILVKHKVVQQDPYEDNLRKTLNYGHTLGHAIESYFLSDASRPTLLHGEAIAIGMILASYISSELTGLTRDACDAIRDSILKTFGRVQILDADFAPIMELLKHDKKNVGGQVNFVLLADIGKPEIDCQVSNDIILSAFDYYRS